MKLTLVALAGTRSPAGIRNIGGNSASERVFDSDMAGINLADAWLNYGKPNMESLTVELRKATDRRSPDVENTGQSIATKSSRYIRSHSVCAPMFKGKIFRLLSKYSDT